MAKTNIDEETRKQILGEAFWAIVSNENYSSEGANAFMNFARLVCLDNAAIKYDPNNWTNPENIDADGNRNYGTNSCIRMLSYLRKNKPEIYQALKPWAEATE